jgi:hypothetical protein
MINEQKTIRLTNKELLAVAYHLEYDIESVNDTLEAIEDEGFKLEDSKTALDKILKKLKK